MEAQLALDADLEQLANFLTTMNCKKAYNIGFVGDVEADILQTLKEDFMLENSVLAFCVIKDPQAQITAAIGLDMDDKSAEVWGPFSMDEGFHNERKLWQLLLQSFPEIEEFHFFIHLENEKQNDFVHQIGAMKTGQHLVLTLDRTDFTAIKAQQLISYEENDFDSFKQLHNESFPSTYYDAETIITRLNDANQLLILKEENHVIGYAYFELNRLVGEVSLEYIALHTQFQNKGWGTKLLNGVINEIFKYPEIDNMNLSVAASNIAAIRMYEKAGFHNKKALISYKLII